MLPNNPLLSKLEPLAMPLIVLFVGVGGFGLGFLSASQAPKEELRVVYPEAPAAQPVLNTAAVAAAAPDPIKPGEGAYVASKNGSKYYLVSCSGANRIKQENRVYFVSVKDAMAAGYEPAANCPGL